MATCTTMPGNLDASGDNLYGVRSCRQDFVDFVWNAYDFDQDDWDDGFGFHDPCNRLLPLARTLNAIFALEFSAPDPNDESWDKPIINWAGRYARGNLDELDARCGDGTAFATTFWGPIIDNYTELYLGYFYTLAAAVRAGTILHEARHASWCGHDAGNNDSSWAYNGAWRWHVTWLAWFINQCSNTSIEMKRAARRRANSILAGNFTTDPGFRIDDRGFAV